MKEKGNQRVAYPDLTMVPQDVAGLVSLLNVNVFRMMAHVHTLVKPMVHLGGTLRFEGVVDRAICEVAILRVGYLSGATYETDSHEVIALAQGIQSNQFAEIREGAHAKNLQSEYRPIIRFVDDIVRNVRASDVTLEPMIETYGIAGAQQLTILIGFYMTICRFSETFDVTRDAEDVSTPSAVTMGSDSWVRLRKVLVNP